LHRAPRGRYSTGTMDTQVPRPEHPRPQFVRPDWLSLNGRWQFEIDQGDSGRERGLITKELSGSITVPFCPESKLSGVGVTDFLNAVWYRRPFTVPSAWKGRRVLLHFQAADYDTTVWLDGRQVGRHRGLRRRGAHPHGALPRRSPRREAAREAGGAP